MYNTRTMINVNSVRTTVMRFSAGSADVLLVCLRDAQVLASLLTLTVVVSWMADRTKRSKVWAHFSKYSCNHLQ